MNKKLLPIFFICTMLFSLALTSSVFAAEIKKGAIRLQITDTSDAAIDTKGLDITISGPGSGTGAPKNHGGNYYGVQNDKELPAGVYNVLITSDKYKDYKGKTITVDAFTPNGGQPTPENYWNATEIIKLEPLEVRVTINMEQLDGTTKNYTELKSDPGISIRDESGINNVSFGTASSTYYPIMTTGLFDKSIETKLEVFLLDGTNIPFYPAQTKALTWKNGVGTATYNLKLQRSQLIVEVLDKATKQPIPNASLEFRYDDSGTFRAVKFDPTYEYSPTLKKYVINNLVAGYNYRVIASAPGYNNANGTTTTELTQGKNTLVAPINLTVATLVKLTGTVIDTLNKPVAGAIVTLYDETGAAVIDATTDAKGVYTFEGTYPERAKYSVKAALESDSDATSTKVEFTVTATPDPNVISKIMMTIPTYKVTYEPRLNGVSTFATVQRLDENGQPFGNPVTTNANNRVTFNNLLKGKVYKFEFTKGDITLVYTLKPEELVKSLDANKVWPVDLGAVDPVEEFGTVIFSIDSDEELDITIAGITAVLQNDGTYKAENVPVGPYTIDDIVVAGKTIAEIDPTDLVVEDGPDATCTITLEETEDETETLTFTFEGLTEAEKANIKVSVADKEANSDNAFTVNVPAGTYNQTNVEVTAGVPTGKTYDVSSVVLAVGDPGYCKITFSPVAQPGTTIKLVNLKSAGVSGLYVEVYVGKGFIGTPVSGITDANGNVKLNLPASTTGYTLVVKASAASTTKLVALPYANAAAIPAQVVIAAPAYNK